MNYLSLVEFIFLSQENTMNYLARAEQAMKTWSHLVRTEQAIQTCVEACSLCHQVCLQTAMTYCLQGGKDVDIEHFRRMIDCAGICQMSVNFQISDSDFYHRLCEICAEVCEACATDCEKIGGMTDCVEVCRDCATSCRQIARVQH
jgi:hypothetical protein